MNQEVDEARFKKRVRLWWGHRIVTALLTGAVIFAAFLFADQGNLYEIDLAWVVRYCVVALPGLFLVQAFTGKLFGRKTRPWQFRTDPADRKPRRPELS